MVSRISLKSLYGRLVRSMVCPGGTKYGAVDSPGDHNFGGTVDSVTAPVSISSLVIGRDNRVCGALVQHR